MEIGNTDLAAEVRGNGSGFEHLWLELMLPALISQSSLRIFQDIYFLCYITVEFVC